MVLLNLGYLSESPGGSGGGENPNGQAKPNTD